MVNQWGRDGNFAASGGRSSGAGVVVIAAVVALALGAGGGYTAARMLTGVSASDIRSRDDKIAELEGQISDLKFKSDGNSDQEAELRDRVEELTKANETLKALADENGGKVDAEAQAEIDALKKTIEEAGDLRTELSRAKRSLQVSELQIIELEDAIKTQRGEIDKLRKNLSDATSEGDAGTRALADRIKALESALADSREQVAAAGQLRKQVASLEDDLAVRTADLDTAKTTLKAAQKDLDQARSEVARLKKALDAALAANTDNNGEGDALRRELDAARKALAAREADVLDLQGRLSTARKDLDGAVARADEAVSESASLKSILESSRATNKKLTDQVARLEKAIEDLKAAQPKEQPADEEPTIDEPLLVKRDADLVRAALEDMPGYARLTADQQSDLATRLEQGDCVADTLKAVIGRVPTVALRNLIRDLGSKC